MHMYEKSVEDMQVTLNKLYQAVGDDIWHMWIRRKLLCLFIIKWH
jgi:hypothetical protein